MRLIWLLLAGLLLLFPPGARAGALRPLEPRLSPGTRLLVFAPHPDDETLGAAGLMQRVLRLGGKVKVVLMTEGDGFPEGVEKEDQIAHPTAADYRGYGALRRQEALKALKGLGLQERDAVFLGFPDGGLAALRLKFRNGPRCYKSPFTLETRPPRSEIIIPQTVYTGHDLTRELERVIGDFRPNLVAVTPEQDEHPDHNATYFFVQKALAHLAGKSPQPHPEVLTYLIHFGQWPIGQGAGPGARLDPPQGFPGKGHQWASLVLTPQEAMSKCRAILEYQSQMLVMGRYLLSFARTNELFLLSQ